MMNKNKQVILFLGREIELKKYFSLVRRDLNGVTAMQACYGDRRNFVASNDFIHLTKGKEMDQIRQAVEGRRLIGVVNRVDSYIPLWGMIQDEFGLSGPGYKAVMKFKDKYAMHRLMLELGLDNYRPKSESVALYHLQEYLESHDLPLVVKPYMGTKSRGVFIVDNASEVKKVVERLERHFQSKRMFRSFDAQEMVLVEEYIEGEQLTYTGYVDRQGNLHTVGCEDVLTGRDVGMKHQQLVYRTVPSRDDHGVKMEVQKMLAVLVSAAGLRSTFIFPEFKVNGDGVRMIELNVRIGGFRSEMYKLAWGIDIRRAAMNLALGSEVRIEKTLDMSSTAVEVWNDDDLIIEKIRIPDSSVIKDKYIFFKPGERYKAPPKGDVPLARFDVVDEKDSLKKAKQLYKQIEVEGQKLGRV